jgi:4-carboxymuconolactone decarboxylase
MSVQTEMLGGRLPLLDPRALSTAQTEVFDRLNKSMVPWAEAAEFQTKTEDGRLIGPFNAMLFNPGIGASFLALHDAEEKHTSLTERVRQVVILAVGAVWRSDYELYAHIAAARKAGISKDSIRMLVADGQPDDLSEQEKIAQRFARRLSAERRVDPALYSAAEQAFGQEGVVDLTYLIGIYHVTCAFLNAFEIPAPGGKPLI